MRSGRSVTKIAHDLDVTSTSIYSWIKQDSIDQGEIPGVTNKESKELVKARRRIRELETEFEILRRANELLGKDLHPKRSTR